jgi:uncharacterized repeat protein (TIGR01451 family)
MQSRVRGSWLAVIVAASVILAPGAASAQAPTWEVGWWTVDGGGVTFGSGGVWVVGSTIAQHDAGGPMAGTPFVVHGGFWALAPRASLSITKTDGQASALPGQPLTYTIVAANAGPGSALGARVTDSPPAVLLGANWTCAASAGSSCPPSGSGAIDQSVDLRAGGTATFTLTGTIELTATGTLVNTASMAAPPGVIDPSAADNSATDTDTLTILADLSVTNTDGLASAVPGEAVTYTIVVGSAGPVPVAGATITDTPTAELLGPTWTCSATSGSSCPASGSGPIAASVDLIAGGSATFTLTGTISPSAVGNLVNSASAAIPAGAVDPDPQNDSATDTDLLTPVADLGVSLSDAPDPVRQGHPLTYTLTVTNTGPSTSAAPTLVQNLPPEVTFVSSTPGAPACVPVAGGLTCALGPIDPGAGASVTVVATVGAGVAGSIASDASIIGGDPDPVSANDADSATTSVLIAVEGELIHGSRVLADLEALPGPAADEDRYRIAQQPYSSYEVVLDGTSGDLGTGSGPALERLASDGITVVQASQAAGAGSSRSLRWETGATPALDEMLRVRSLGCASDCGPEDVYRLRAYETTASAPRFNNSATQATALLLQNTGVGVIAGHAYFVGASGVVLQTVPFSISSHRVLVMSTVSFPALIGQSGTIRVTHDGRYGELVGKAVALEVATAFTFDTPLLPRPR